MYVKTKQLISKYGQSIIITSPTGKKIYSKAFIQPLRCDQQSELYGDYVTNEGTEQFLYVGTPDVQMSSMPSGTILTTKNQNYIIKKAENVYLSEKAVYERAVLEKE